MTLLSPEGHRDYENIYHSLLERKNEDECFGIIFSKISYRS